MLGQALFGAGYAVRGARFLAARPRLWGWVVAPYLVTLALFGGLGWAAFSATSALVAWATGWMPSGLAAVLGPILGILIAIGLAFAMLYVYFAVATVVAGPFCELLAEAAEVAHTGRPSPRFSVTRLLADLARTVVHELRRTLRYLFFIVVLAVLSMIVPGPGTVLVAIVGFYVAARFVAWDVLDWTLGRRGLAYRDKVAYLARHRGATTGLGMVVAGGLAIPLVGPLFLPVGAVGAMLLVTDLEARPGG